MSYLDETMVWFLRILATVWLAWGLLHLIDYPVCWIIKFIGAYWTLVNYSYHRKAFKVWLNHTKPPRYNENGEVLEK